MTTPASGAGSKASFSDLGNGALVTFERPITKNIEIYEGCDELCYEIADRATAIINKVASQKPLPMPKNRTVEFPMDAVVFPSPSSSIDAKVISTLTAFFKSKKDSSMVVTQDELLDKQKNHLERWITEIRTEAINFCAKALGMEVIPLPDKFSPEEVDLLGFPPNSDVNIGPSQITCYHYALLKAKEPRVLELNDLPNEKFIGKLQEWGYTNTKDLKKGDIILYLQDGSPKHLGYYLGDGWVESKPGNAAAYAYRHRLLDTREFYGDQYAIFRRR